MAVSDPLIFESFSIQDAGGSNSETFELMDSDNVEITNEAEKLTVDNAQEIISGLTSGMTVPCFDLAVQSDPHVIMDSQVDPTSDKAEIVLNGASGSAGVKISGVYVTGVLKFDRPSPYIQLSVQIKGASAQVSIV